MKPPLHSALPTERILHFARRESVPPQSPRHRRRIVDLRDPVAFGEALLGPNGYRMYDYQTESIRCTALRKCHCDGRDVGKTTEIELTHLRFALAHPHSESLICAQWQHNLSPTMERLVTLCTSHPVLVPRVRRVLRSPFYRIEFGNGSLLLGKIAGNRGVNFQNTHVDLISVDEAQNMLDVSWDELLPALRTGGRLHVYGVPNGLRNRFYQFTHDSTFAQFRWPSRLNPRFTPEKDEELQRLYGGPLSEGYVHNVLGEHGAACTSAFDVDCFLRCVEDRDEMHLCLHGEQAACADTQWGSLPVTSGTERMVLGADVGYTRDPTVFVCWRVGNPDKGLCLVSQGLVELIRVPYETQAAVLAALADRTGAEAIACDRGGGGIALLQALGRHRPDLLPRIVRGADGELGIPFNETVEVEFSGFSCRQKMKPATTDLYQHLAERGQLRLGRSARLDQMADQTYHCTDRGEIVYSKGNDHILDADRTVMYWVLTRETRRAQVLRYGTAVDEV